MRLPTAKFETYMQKWFYSLGVSIGTHPKRWITVLLAVTVVSCLGFLRFHQINNARVTFTAHDSPSHMEGAKFDAFLRQNGTLHMIEVLISASDGGNLLRPDHLNQLNEMTKWMRNGIKVEGDQGQSMGYMDMCEPYCEKNDAFFAVIDLFKTNSSNFEITYPKTSLFGHQILVANNLYGVETYSSTKKIRSFTTAMLRFYLTNPTWKPLLAFENGLIDICYHSDKFPLLTGQVGSDVMVSKEVKRLGSSAAPYLGISLGLLILFLIICSLRYRRSESKPLEACLGALIPVLSGITTVGMVSATGLAFQSIIVSTLFLVLAIGIDDVFIILSAWHRADKTVNVGHRVGLTVREAGCSMTVTTITNLISFGNGVLSTTPVLQTFAIYSSVASVICYLYQLIIFPAILAITAGYEEEVIEISEVQQEKTWEFIKALSAWGDRRWKSLADNITSTDKKNITRILTISILLGYWYLSGLGIATMKTDLSIQKMGDNNSAIVRFKDTLDKVLIEMQSVAVLVDTPQDLRESENLEELKQVVKDFEEALNSYGRETTMSWLGSYLEWMAFFKENGMEEEEVEEKDDLEVTTRLLETTTSKSQRQASRDPRAVSGARALQNQDLEKSSSKNHGSSSPTPSPIPTSTFTYSDIPAFLDSQPQYRPTLRLNHTLCLQNHPGCLQKFVFTTGFTSVVKYAEMYPMVRNWREIAANHPKWGIYPYTERSNFVDQTEDMVQNIWITVVSEVICMAVSFVFFIPDTISIVSAVFSLLSVNFGVFGFLSIWKVGMDPVSLASLLMSIGFSVDISAHISYHYYQVDKPTPQEKLLHVYTHIGWPTLQGGLSTMLAMMPILMSKSYLGMVFLKTVILVSCFGLLHGLIILPVFLTLFSDTSNFLQRFRNRRNLKISDSNMVSNSSSISNLPHQISIGFPNLEKSEKF